MNNDELLREITDNLIEEANRLQDKGVDSIALSLKCVAEAILKAMIKEAA